MLGMHTTLFTLVRNVGRKTLYSLKSRGLTKTLAAAFETAWSMSQQKILRRAPEFPDQFDTKFEVDTSGQVPAIELKIPSNNFPFGIKYQPTPVQQFVSVLEGMGLKYEDYVFIDFGSGKGRVLLLASEFPFKRIIGVEYSSFLHTIALDNVLRYKSDSQKCREIEAICIDAVDFVVPNEPALFYFYNPFGEPVFSTVLHNIEHSWSECPRDLMIFYWDPVLHHLIDESPHWHLICKNEKFRIYGIGA